MKEKFESFEVKEAEPIEAEENEKAPNKLERFVERQVKLAEVYESVVQEIKQDPNISPDWVTAITKAELVESGVKLGKEEGAGILRALNWYKEKNELMQKTEKAFTERDPKTGEEKFNTKDFTEIVFDKKLQGEAEVKFGPVSITILLKDRRDFDQLLGLESKGCGGVIINHVKKMPELDRSLIIIPENEDIQEQKVTIAHEEQHAVNTPFIDKKKYGLKKELTKTESREEIIDDLLKVVKKNLNNYAVERAKDEIIAYLASEANVRKEIPKRNYLETLKDILFRSKSDGGHYDYTQHILSIIYDGLLKSFDEYDATTIVKDLKESEEYRDLFYQYHSTIERGIDAFIGLQNEFGFSVEKTIGFLANKPLKTWEKWEEALAKTTSA